MNSFGLRYRLTSFGESHGPAIGGVIDGIEPGLAIDLDAVQAELDRRRPGQSAITTARLEADRLEVLSGVFEGKTLGTPIGFVVRNADQRPGDYDAHALRPSHADYTHLAKYGIRDHRGGGRASARETIARVVAGAFARQALAPRGIEVRAYVSQVGAVTCDKPYTALDLSLTDSNPVRCPDPETAALMEAEIRAAQSQGDTVGGVATCVITGVHAGLGSPVFDKLQSRLAAAMLSINAAKGFDYGMGFAGAAGRGSDLNDAWLPGFKTATNHSGGIQGGISNGQDIYCRVAFKPVATLMREIETIDDQGRPATLPARGRHDPCVLPRAVPIVEAMALMVIYDAILDSRR